MATGTTAKAQCCICNKEKNTYKCGGCSKDFCFNHLTEHRQSINQQFDEIENYHDQFRQTILKQKNDPQKHPLINQINKWEEDSIQKIKQTAQESRRKLIKYMNNHIIVIENQLNHLAKQLKEIREENEFNEADLNQLREKLTKLAEELAKPSNVIIEQESSSFIGKISVIVPIGKGKHDIFKSDSSKINGKISFSIFIMLLFYLDSKWKQFGVTIAGRNHKGSQLNQFSFPGGIFLDDDDQTIYIADQENHRIVEWKLNATNGQIIAGGNGPGNQMNQLNKPADVILDQETNSLIIADSENRRVMRWARQSITNGEILISDIDCIGLTMDKNGSFYVSDCEKNEVRRWKRGDKEGTIVAGGNGKGDHLNQLDHPTFLFVDEDVSLYVSDNQNHRVVKWVKDAKEGIVVAGGNEGDSLTQLNRPNGIIIDQLGQIYVADSGNHRVMRWYAGVKEGSIVVDGNGEGEQSNQLNGPTDLSFDHQGNLYVVDYYNHRIQKFEIE
jgi:sugar lactone lactonase YvrE